MHILPVYFTTTNTRKRKKSKKPASLIEAEHQHAKFIEKMKVDVRNNNVDQALRILKKKLQLDGLFNEMRERAHFTSRGEKRREEAGF